jgi:hypothetical protein
MSGRHGGGAPQPGAAVFIGAARDCAQFLPRALERWDALATCFECAHFIVAENDSTDGTKAILGAWAAARPDRTLLTLDGIEADQIRTVRLAAVRNRLLEEVRSREDLRRASYLVVMDLDYASLLITPARLRRSLALEGWDGLFANQLFYYYDVWALRDERRSPDDWVERVSAAPPGWRRAWARLRHLEWRGRPFWPWREPIPVKSAFGGLAIYRMPLPPEARYVGLKDGHTVCEHVAFNEALVARGARLFIDPRMINLVPRAYYPLFKWLGAG